MALLFEDRDIHFFAEDIDFSFDNGKVITHWMYKTAEKENELNSTTFEVEEINVIFCSDEYLRKINIEYLDHDYYTDVITFPYSEDTLHSDIFISIDRIRDNAQKFNTTFDRELNRVIIHGYLHLFGHKDKTEEDQKLMREKEDFHLHLLFSNLKST